MAHDWWDTHQSREQSHQPSAVQLREDTTPHMLIQYFQQHSCQRFPMSSLSYEMFLMLLDHYHRAPRTLGADNYLDQYVNYLRANWRHLSREEQDLANEVEQNLPLPVYKRRLQSQPGG